MGIVAVKMKIMPSSPEVDMEKIRNSVTKILESNGGKNPGFEEEPVAFGLKSLVVLFAWPEERDMEILEKEIGDVENVSSVQIVDMRRAFG